MTEPGPDAKSGRHRMREATGRVVGFISQVGYPHGIHPALVPGVAIEDQRVRYRIDRPIVLVVGTAIVGFIIWGVLNPASVGEVSGIALEWVTQNLGWVFNTLATGMAVFLLVLAFTRYGRIPLGLDGEKREYSSVSWVAMLFAAGIGIGIIFFGTFEPLSHYLDPLPGLYEPDTTEAIRGAMAQSALHWGINAWAIYAIVGLCVAYVSFRRGRVPLMSSVLTPLWNGESTGAGARVIDGLAIFATLFGTAASLGIGALQIGRGVEIVSGIGAPGNTIAMIIIMILTAGTIISAVSGINRGIRRLSNVNLALSIGLAVFFFVVGPTAFLLNVIPGVVTEYFGSMPEMLGATMSDGEPTQEFLTSWTTFYWAWWVSWSPFVGVFVAKISRGRTIRQFVLGVLFIPSTIIVGAFTLLGGTSIWLQREHGEIAPDGTAESLPVPEEIFYVVVDQLPGGAVLAPLVIVILAIFFITAADSASLVNSQMSQQGNPEPKRPVTAFWALCMAGIAVVILLVGDEEALTGLQNLVTVSALPFSVIIIAMAVALMRELRSDPQVIRYTYENWALAHAVERGVEEHGDHWVLSVDPVTPSDEHATGEAMDTSDEEVTAWYQRTDEEGDPVGYDYETGEYLDEHDPGGGTGAGTDESGKGRRD